MNIDPATHGEPYCTACGYVLKGAIKSATCPECGRPLVEVMGRKGAIVLRGKRYRSKLQLFGLPVVDVAFGPGEGNLRGRAKGIIAAGDIATGVLAVGGFARGVVTFGGICLGVMSFGGLSVGVLSAAGGMAIGLGAAVGGVAASAGLAMGGMAVGALAQGGNAMGWFSRGGMAMGLSPAGNGSPESVAAFDRFSWFFGAWPPTMGGQLITIAVLILPAFVVAAITGALVVAGGRPSKDAATAVE
jgi:hypothetical protein